MKISGSQPRVRSCHLGEPALGANASILADTAMDAADPTILTVDEIGGQPDVPRNLTVKGNDANVAGNVEVSGTNVFGELIVETIALAGVAVVAGSKAFATVHQIELPKYAAAATERVRVGTGAKLGLPLLLWRDTVLAAFRDGAREANRPAVAVSADAVESNTVTLSSALDGSPVVVDLYETH